jgi:hypothetical protein
MSGAAAAIVNAALRIHILWFLVEVLAYPDDPRFAGKAIPIRNAVIVGLGSLVFPVAYLVFKRWRRYPWWLDDLYLSVYWLDMAGNSFDLYDTYADFDLIPHFHGTGAFAAVFALAFEMSTARAFWITNLAHAALEAQEIFTDIFGGTHNVRGWIDTVRDMVAGLAGSAAYLLASRTLRL